MEVRFDKIDSMLKDPKSEINTDCLLVSLRLASYPHRRLSEATIRVSLLLGAQILSVTNKSYLLSLEECADIEMPL